MEAAPICRWIVDGITVDTMPMKSEVLGFSNDYYAVAIRTAVTKEISEALTIRLVSAPCFLATKIEAFRGRGKGDFLASPDMEDIVAVLSGRPEIVEEIKNSDMEIRVFLVAACAALLEDDDFIESIPGHLEYDGHYPNRVPTLLERIRAIAFIEV